VKRLDVAVNGSMGLYSCILLTERARRFAKNKIVVGSWQTFADTRFMIEGGDRCRAIVAGMVKEKLKVTVNGVDMKGFRDS